MYFDSKSYDVKLVNDKEGNSFEMWWILDENEILILSCCPEKYPFNNYSYNENRRCCSRIIAINR